ncbi:choice-of-anchor E domain-containing protein [Rhodoferax sp.]|uniref:choice-of-anchor E domain-containing protein n=1 Tax=Rhodoferax sp. TaxID=50421 RepID=UPI00374D4356
MHTILKFAAASLIALTSLAQAASISYTSNTAPLDYTDWDYSLSLQKFNTSLGSLNSITITLYGETDGNIRLESTDAAPSALSASLSSMLTLTRPDLTTLVVTTPLTPVSFNASAYDGTLDWAGTSGQTWLNLTANAKNFVNTSSAADKALFSGPGFVLTPLHAAGLSAASGSGNFAFDNDTQATAFATITYNYAPVPEPASWALMVGGLALLARRAVQKQG